MKYGYNSIKIAYLFCHSACKSIYHHKDISPNYQHAIDDTNATLGYKGEMPAISSKKITFLLGKRTLSAKLHVNDKALYKVTVLQKLA